MGVDTMLAQRDRKKRPVPTVDPAHREIFLGDVRKAIVYAQRLEIPHVLPLTLGGREPNMKWTFRHGSEAAKTG